MEDVLESALNVGDVQESTLNVGDALESAQNMGRSMRRPFGKEMRCGMSLMFRALSRTSPTFRALSGRPSEP